MRTSAKILLVIIAYLTMCAVITLTGGIGNGGGNSPLTVILIMLFFIGVAAFFKSNFKNKVNKEQIDTTKSNEEVVELSKSEEITPPANKVNLALALSGTGSGRVGFFVGGILGAGIIVFLKLTDPYKGEFDNDPAVRLGEMIGVFIVFLLCGLLSRTVVWLYQWTKRRIPNTQKLNSKLLLLLAIIVVVGSFILLRTSDDNTIKANSDATDRTDTLAIKTHGKATSKVEETSENTNTANAKLAQRAHNDYYIASDRYYLGSTESDVRKYVSDTIKTNYDGTDGSKSLIWVDVVGVWTILYFSKESQTANMALLIPPKKHIPSWVSDFNKRYTKISDTEWKEYIHGSTLKIKLQHLDNINGYGFLIIDATSSSKSQ